MTTNEIKEEIKQLRKEIKTVPEYSKRWVFLAATINRYNKQLGKGPVYKW